MAPSGTALALGSMLLGAAQTCTFKNCGQKEMTCPRSQAKYTLCIYLLTLRAGSVFAAQVPEMRDETFFVCVAAGQRTYKLGFHPVPQYYLSLSSPCPSALCNDLQL